MKNQCSKQFKRDNTNSTDEMISNQGINLTLGLPLIGLRIFPKNGKNFQISRLIFDAN